MNILQKIIEYKKTVVENQKIDCGFSISEMEKICKELPHVNSFIKAVENKKAQNKSALIAEVKKASPSKGLIREDFDPLKIAKEYVSANVDAISVLTDEKYFQGSIKYLEQIREITKTPILRKDFIVDPFQIYNSRLLGADMILLIASALSKDELNEFYKIAKSIGLEVLIEVHDEEEFDAAYETGAKLIGINNRNLGTFEVNIETSIRIIKNKNINNRYIISESGINFPQDIEKLKNAGVNGFLIGEHFMRKNDIKKAIIDLFGNNL